MTTAGDILGGNDAGIHERLVEVPQVVLAACRGGGVQRDVPALRTDDDLVACGRSRRDRLAQYGADRALGALASIVDRRVDDVDASVERATHGYSVPRVIDIVAFAEIRADAQR